MPYRTFEEARKHLARAEGRVPPERLDAMREEFDQRVQASRDQIKRLSQSQRAAFDAQLNDLVQQAKDNRERLKRATQDRKKQRLSESEYRAEVQRVAGEQRVLKAQAGRVRHRLDLLDERVADPTESVDRIARHTGLGKQHFSF